MMDEILQDMRFAHVTHDPSFKRIPRRERKVKIDKRFQSMFHDKNFQVKYTVDKRGRPTNFTSKEDLKRFYELDSDSQPEDLSEAEESLVTLPEDEIETKIPKSIYHNLSTESKRLDFDETPDGIDVVFSNESSNDDDDDDDKDVDNNEDFKTGAKCLSKKVKQRLQDLTIDYARGEGAILSDSSSDESSEEEGLDEEEEVDHKWGELDQDAERTDQETRRLAVCHMNWDRIHASDLMVLFHSFLPKGGVIHSVKIYPSEYGMQRMKEEEEKGPRELTEETETQDGSENEEDEEGDGLHYRREKLRRYQLNRLRYYYAVVECDSEQTASALYECDGMEYESSAARLDLRFVPEDTQFDQEPREMCTELPDMKKYEPQLFITTALQQSKVRLTWDETDPRRVEFTKKIMSGKADDIDDNDLKVYLASSSSEVEEEEEIKEGNDSNLDAASKYRALLHTIESEEKAKKDKEMEMEVTWGIGLKEKVEKRLKEGAPETKTPFQQYLDKRKEKMKAKKKERTQKKREVAESDEDNGIVFSDDDIPSDVDLNDPYFTEEFEGDQMKIPNKGQKIKRKEKRKEEDDSESKQKKAELELLLMDQDDDRHHFSLKDILENESNKNMKKKKKLKRKLEELKKQTNFQVNVKDERFSALYTSHLYNIDPADPHYRKTKGMEALRAEKLNRRQEVEEVPQVPSKIPKKQHKYNELSLLVKNVKMKTQHLNKY